MQSQKIFLANITCRCPSCDKLFDVKRFIEQHKPVNPETCFILCVDCRKEVE